MRHIEKPAGESGGGLCGGRTFPGCWNVTPLPECFSQSRNECSTTRAVTSASEFVPRRLLIVRTGHMEAMLSPRILGTAISCGERPRALAFENARTWLHAKTCIRPSQTDTWGAGGPAHETVKPNQPRHWNFHTDHWPQPSPRYFSSRNRPRKFAPEDNATSFHVFFVGGAPRHCRDRRRSLLP